MSMKRIGLLVILGCLLLTMTACGNESKDTSTLPSTVTVTKEDVSAGKTENDTVDFNTGSDKEVKREPIIINLQSIKDIKWGTSYPDAPPDPGAFWFHLLLAELVESPKNSDNLFDVVIGIEGNGLSDEEIRRFETEEMRRFKESGLRLEEMRRTVEGPDGEFEVVIHHGLLSGKQLRGLVANPNCATTVWWNLYQEDERMVRPVTPTSEPMVINLGLEEPLQLGMSTAPEAGALRCETLLNYFIESKECEEHLLDVMVKIYPYGDLTLEDEVKRLSDEGFTFTETHGFVYCGRFTGKQLQNFPKNAHCGYEIGWNMFD